jgi:ApbE superfamily uncharacterized protein (UPF0280 family)
VRYVLDHKHAHIIVISDRDYSKRAQKKLVEVYSTLEGYIIQNPFFGISYEPVEVSPKAPEVARIMAEAGMKAGVGPMAAVAGAIAETLGRFLNAEGAGEIVVENGGDIFLQLKSKRKIGIHAGRSPFSNKLALHVKPEETPLGVCTSAATVGHSVSLGEADAVVAVAKSTPLADAAATAIGNEVKGKNGVKKGIKKAKSIPDLAGVIIIRGDELATWGKLPEIVGTDFNL